MFLKYFMGIKLFSLQVSVLYSMMCVPFFGENIFKNLSKLIKRQLVVLVALVAQATSNSFSYNCYFIAWC